MEKGLAKILLDKRWKLEDFSILTKEYQQLYGFFFVLRSIEAGKFSNLEFERMPWLGDGSVVGFFGSLIRFVHPQDQPEVAKIQYASPGFIELNLYIEVAKDISALVATIAGAISSAATTYHLVHSQYQKRKLTQLKIKDLQMKQQMDEIEFVARSVQELHKTFNLNNKQIEALQKLSKNDELVQLKMLLALYRRAEPVAKLQEQQKAKFDNA